MLLNLLGSPGMLETIAAPHSYRPRWTIGDRQLWDRIAEPTRRFWIARAERYLDFDWPPLEPMYSDYERTGVRTRFEALYHRRRQIAATFAFAELFENAGRFIAPLLDAMRRVCDEPTWVLPAHEKHPIDLFSAETANMLAWLSYLFSDVPAFRDAVAAKRARAEVEARVISPYLARSDCWWMALNGESPSNWTTWCTSNCLGAALLVETDAARRAAVVQKACRSLDRFVDAYAEDGGCDEGPMYWNFAAGCLFDSLEMLFEASGGAFDVFGESAIKNLGGYIARVHVHDLFFVNFADSPPQVPVDAALLYRFGQRIGDPHMQALGAHLHRLLDRCDPEDTLRLKIYRALATFEDGPDLRQIPGPDAAPLDSYLPKLQLVVVRETARTDKGLFLAAKGGHNDEQHNHNDVGNVIVYLDGRPVVIDVGLRQYTRDSFSERRYENWVVQSAYHNVPVVNGRQQAPGAAFRARAATFDGRDDEVRFGIEIAAAYPPAAGLARWSRTAVLERVRGRVTIQDDFVFVESGNSYELRFMTPLVPRIAGGYVVLPVDATLAVLIGTTPVPSRVSLHSIALADGHLQHAWGRTLYQVRLHFENVTTQGRCQTVLRTHRGDVPLVEASNIEVEQLA
jgi:hypothetical protein